jgi:hypothetical protein
MKKITLLSLGAFSAMLALPVLASAIPAHLSTLPPEGKFSVHGGASTLATSGGSTTTGKTVTGSGTFENTTTGTMKLAFHGVQSDNPTTNCASTGEGHSLISGGGTVTTTTLPFHLVNLSTIEEPGILITPNATVGVDGKPISGTAHFGTYKCAGGLVTVVVKGNGVLGKIKKPRCGESSNTAIVSFFGGGGTQFPSIFTETSYGLQSTTNGGAAANASLTAEMTITFAGGHKPWLVCTNWW